MKKIALLLVCFLMTLACISIAEEAPLVYACGDYEYKLLDNGTAEIADYFGDSLSLKIPEKLDGYVVTSIRDYAFAWCESLIEITIPDSVTSIGNCAFYKCASLTEITIPDSVTSIGDCAFGLCESLTEITIPDSVTSIGLNPFGLCIKLTKIKLSPEHPTSATIDGVLFDKTEKKLIFYPFAFTAESYSIPQGISSIGDWAFFSCFYPTEISIPNSVTSIGDVAFCYCSSLTEITIPDSVTYIGDEAFSYCSSLTEITIPDSVTYIGDNAFYGCDFLTITVDRDSYAAKYAKENGLEYTYTDALDWLNS